MRRFGTARAAAPIVEVLAEKRVAGYDAKVLKANDANALTMWLNDAAMRFARR